MKKLLITSSLLYSLLLAGCGTTSQPAPQDFSAYSGAMSMYTGSMAVVEEKKFPTCITKLQPYEILDMNTLVKNCSRKEKEGIVLDGLGGVFQSYEIYNDKLVKHNDSDSLEGVVCKDGEVTYTLVSPNDAIDQEELISISVIEKIIGKGLLDNMFISGYPDNIYCKKNDTDCSDMKNFGGRTEGENYFVAGYRSDSPLYYAINGKLYNPGENKMGRGFLQESKRNFAGIKDNKILVKRITGAQLKGNPNLDDPKLDLTTVKTSFTLETCEIDL